MIVECILILISPVICYVWGRWHQMTSIRRWGWSNILLIIIHWLIWCACNLEIDSMNFICRVSTKNLRYGAPISCLGRSQSTLTEFGTFWPPFSIIKYEQWKIGLTFWKTLLKPWNWYNYDWNCFSYISNAIQYKPSVILHFYPWNKLFRPFKVLLISWSNNFREKC